MLSWVCSANTQSTIIYVDDNGTYNEGCGTESSPCKNLTYAIYCINNGSSVAVYIKQGQYELLASPGTTFNNSGKDITIKRDGEGVVEIVCREPGAGLTFIKSEAITISGVIFNGCGVEHPSTSYDFNNHAEDIKFLTSNVALYFEGCSSITLDYVTIKNSLGIAVQIYYTLGTNYITNSVFIDNPGQYGINNGGGVYIEFPYCFPGDTACNDETTQLPTTSVSNSEYIITGCQFIRNTAKNEISSEIYVLPFKFYHVAFGQGGGLSVFFKGNASNNHITIENCSFNDNRAVFGGGIYVDMHDYSYNNSVVVTDGNVFSSNTAQQSGGGAYFSYFFLPNFGHISSSSFLLENASFVDNYALNGGALFYITTRQGSISDSSSANTLVLVNCNYFNNTAKIGAAIHLTPFHGVSEGLLYQVNMTNTIIKDNSVKYKDSLGKQLGAGAMYVNGITVYFYKFVLFANNYDGTALVAAGSKMLFGVNTTALFLQNLGRNGGAIGLYSGSFIKIHKNTTFQFESNKATNLGGAIYAEYLGVQVRKTSMNCFIQYYDIMTSPTHWETLFNFTNNKGSRNSTSIYATSILPCVLGRGFGPLTSNQSKVDEVFCWNTENETHWVYDFNTTIAVCKTQILTDAAMFVDNGLPLNISVIPGKPTKMNITATDDQGEDVISDLVLHIYNTSDSVTVDEQYSYTYNDKFVLYKTEHDQDNAGTVAVDTVSQNIIQTELHVEFLECPPGLALVDGGCRCTGNFNNHVKCHNIEFHAELLRGFWIGQSPFDRNNTVVGHCKNCNFGIEGHYEGYIKLNDSLKIVDRQLCGPYNKGVLCSSCIDGYAPAINTHQIKCVKCTSVAPGIVLFIIFDLILPFLFIFGIFFVDIPLTSGLLHGPILFGQMVTSVIALDGDDIIPLKNIPDINEKAPEIIEAMYFFVYDIYNLNFGNIWLNFCISKDIHYATIIAIEYISAFLPMIFVIAVGIIYCQDKRDGCIRKCASKLKNAPNALATFILLSYTKLAVITGFLLTPVPLKGPYDTSSNNSGQVLYLDGNIKYNSSEYYPYLIAALLIGVPFVVMVPIFLFCFRSNDPKNNAGFFNHLLHQFQKEFRDGKDDFDITLDNIADTHLRCKERKNEDGSCGVCWRYEYYCCTSTTLCSYKQKKSRYCRIAIYTSWSLYDLRWIAGGFFMLRILIILPYMIAWNIIIQYMMQFIFCMFGGIAIIVIRPYKKNTYKYVDPNVVEALSLFLLAIIIALSMYQYYYTVIGIPLSTWGYVVQTVLVWVPFVWTVLAYIGLYVERYHEMLNKIRKWCCSKGNSNQGAEVELRRPFLTKGNNENVSTQCKIQESTPEEDYKNLI